MKRSVYLLNGSTLLLAGCMGYQPGGSRPEGINTVAMGPVINRTGEPAMELQITHAMRDRIQLDGRMKLANEPDNADALIEIKLVKFSLRPIAYDESLKTTPRIYRMTITGTAALRNTKTGKVISESDAYGEATFNFENDLTTSKRDAMPTAAAELAKFMLDDLIEYWN
ncbi:LPS assembly lipoprotein LptE [Pontiella sp.]|uniref:LPS assembly lipoprotein LptE n=1 Tax=Pontiella sp. TaxID=2837462 RepID=UPI003562CCB3